MWNEPSVEDLKLLSIPNLYETESIATEKKLIYVHYFLYPAEWFVAEWDGADLFYGYANLGDDQCAEWGYLSFSELMSIKLENGLEVEFDTHWQIKPVKDITKILFSCRKDK